MVAFVRNLQNTRKTAYQRATTINSGTWHSCTPNNIYQGIFLEIVRLYHMIYDISEIRCYLAHQKMFQVILIENLPQ